MRALETTQHREITIEISHDQAPAESPWDTQNLGTIIGWDLVMTGPATNARRQGLNRRDFASHRYAVCLPVYMLDR